MGRWLQVIRSIKDILKKKDKQQPNHEKGMCYIYASVAWTPGKWAIKPVITQSTTCTILPAKLARNKKLIILINYLLIKTGPDTNDSCPNKLLTRHATRNWFGDNSIFSILWRMRGESSMYRKNIKHCYQRWMLRINRLPLSCHSDKSIFVCSDELNYMLILLHFIFFLSYLCYFIVYITLGVLKNEKNAKSSN